MEKVRIQKLLAEAGTGSRRDVEEMILQGRISVNGQVVASLPCFVEISDEILVDGQSVRKRPEDKVYVLLNKPKGVICTQRDEPGFHRPKAVDLIPNIGRRVYCVGRLDEESTGLIVLTNDGELTQALTHPSFEVEKTYIVGVDGNLTAEEVDMLRRGRWVAGRRTRGAWVKVIHRGREQSLMEVKIAESRNLHVRPMLVSLGHKVCRMHRSAIGPIDDRGLKIGRFRFLTGPEVTALRQAAGQDKRTPRNVSAEAPPPREEIARRGSAGQHAKPAPSARPGGNRPPVRGRGRKPGK